MKHPVDHLWLFLAGLSLSLLLAAGCSSEPDQNEPGRQLFVNQGCLACHGASATAQGPSLAGLFGSTVILADGSEAIADESYLRESMVNPQVKLVKGYQPLMPVYKNLLTEEQLDELVAYIKALR